MRTWATLIPYAQQRTLDAGAFPELEALQDYLLYVIHTRTIELVVRSAAPAPAGEERGTPPAVRLGADKARFDAGLPALMEGASRHLARAHRTLHPDMMPARVPGAWAARTKAGRKVEKGGYRLPIDGLTPPAEAVRFAAEVVREWVRGRKGVEYELKSVA